jgi:hypothetical protein
VSSSEEHGINRSGGEKQVVVASDKLRGREAMLVSSDKLVRNVGFVESLEVSCECFALPSMVAEH